MKVSKICENCGIDFEVYKSREQTAKYCSTKCYYSRPVFCKRILKGVKCTNERKTTEFYCSQCSMEVGEPQRYYPHITNKDLVLDITL